jgi:hypothetical protein
MSLAVPLIVCIGYNGDVYFSVLHVDHKPVMSCGIPVELEATVAVTYSFHKPLCLTATGGSDIVSLVKNDLRILEWGLIKSFLDFAFSSSDDLPGCLL